MTSFTSFLFHKIFFRPENAPNGFSATLVWHDRALIDREHELLKDLAFALFALSSSTGNTFFFFVIKILTDFFPTFSLPSNRASWINIWFQKQVIPKARYSTLKWKVTIIGIWLKSLQEIHETVSLHFPFPLVVTSLKCYSTTWSSTWRWLTVIYITCILYPRISCSVWHVRCTGKWIFPRNERKSKRWIILRGCAESIFLNAKIFWVKPKKNTSNSIDF